MHRRKIQRNLPVLQKQASCLTLSPTFTLQEYQNKQHPASCLTLSPTFTVRTSRPTSTTVPAHSEPGVKGSLGFSWYRPCRQYQAMGAA